MEEKTLYPTSLGLVDDSATSHYYYDTFNLKLTYDQLVKR